MGRSDSAAVRLAPLEEERIFQQLRNCDPIRYAAYRTAVKLVSQVSIT